MTITDKYRFELTYLGTTRPFDPCFSNFPWKYEKDDEFAFFTKEMTNNISFYGDDFTWFLAIENGCDRCEPIYLNIYCKKSEDLIYTGFINLLSGAWDLDNCEVSLKVAIEDEYLCLVNGWEEEKNLLNNTPKQTVGATCGTVEYITCTGTGQPTIVLGNTVFPQINDCIQPDITLWSLASNTATKNNTSNNNGPIYDITTIWARYTKTTQCVGGVTVPPSDNGWILLVDNCAVDGTATYVKPALTYLESENINDVDFNSNLGLPDYELIYDVLDEISNGVLLSDALEELNPCPDLTIVSDYFGINPDNTNPNNIAYDYAIAELHNLILFQNTDVTNFNATSDATRADISFQKLLEILSCFNIVVFIEDGNLRIEHVSYVNTVNGIDLTADQYDGCLTGKGKYEYNNTDLPYKEIWKNQNTVSPQFEAYNFLDYPDCSTIGKVDEYGSDCVNFDIEYALENPDEIDNDGFFLVAAGYDGTNYYLENDLTVPIVPVFGDKLNGALSWYNIIHNLWLHDRPQPIGFIPDVPVVGQPVTPDVQIDFITTKRNKLQRDITIPICCSELSNFDPRQLIKTQFGWGEIKTGEYDPAGGCMIVDLLHDQLECI